MVLPSFVVWLLTVNVVVTAVGQAPRQSAPTITVLNGSYHGIYNPTYDEDLFLGMPYAKPPVGALRFHTPASLNTTWSGAKNATQYGPECIGYGGDDWTLGNPVSEDCLTINVIRPAGTQPGDKLPVATWIYGGGYTVGGSLDPRYNLSFIVQNSAAMGTPMIGVSLNYRVQAWGFMYSQELAAEGSSNLAIRDQRLALHWIQENIAAFGGDPTKVTIWGESAGANSVGYHMILYGGRDDGLFRAGISESGAPTGTSPWATIADWQPYYDAVVEKTNCSNTADTLACLRTVPTEMLSNTFNSSTLAGASFQLQYDNDTITHPTAAGQMREGKFVKVPYLIGSNHDEGTMFGKKGINTTEQFRADVMSNGPDNETATTILALYPDIPEIGIPPTLHGRPPADVIGTYGYQWKRSAAYGGDLTIHSGRRYASRTWAGNNLTAYTYLFNVVVNGQPDYIGATHFQEVAFVFDNTQGLGYETAVAVDPFANEPATFFQLANIMSRMWVSFVVNLDPNLANVTCVHWPKYSLDNPQNIVFDVNVTKLAYAEPDIYRAAGIKYIMDRLETVYRY